MFYSTPESSAIEAVLVNARKQSSLLDFLQSHDYTVDHMQEKIYRIRRENLEVFVNIDENNLFFEVPIGEVEAMESIEFYRALLDLNTEILPVSLALDTASSDKTQLIIVESRERKNLDENEVLGVLEAMEIAMARVEILLSKVLAANK